MLKRRPKRHRAYKGRFTKPNAWDEAAKQPLIRIDPLDRKDIELDRGINFFILMLERLGAETFFSCEGHPDKFYIVLSCTYATILRIAACGYLTIELSGGEGQWRITRNTERGDGEPEKVDHLRWAAKAWEEKFGALEL